MLSDDLQQLLNVFNSRAGKSQITYIAASIIKLGIKILNRCII